MSARSVGVAVLVGGAVLAGCSAPPSPPSPPVPPVPASVAPAVPAPAPAGPTQPSRPTALPVYYVADTERGRRLAREFHRVDTADPASDAVREMLSGPVGTDPDYRSHWPSGATLRTPVVAADGTITVDLSGVGTAQLDADLAALTVQQLVFTVQGALQSTDPVRILSDGEPVNQLWDAVDTAAPVARGDIYALRAAVQIDDPAEGATTPGTVEVRGEAAVFEATLHWDVLRDGAVVRSGVATTAEGQRFAPYSFTVALDPGTYSVRVTEDDPSAGAGGPPLTDDKTITVGA